MSQQGNSSEEDFDPSQLLFDDEENNLDFDEVQKENPESSGAISFSSLLLGKLKDSKYTPLSGRETSSSSANTRNSPPSSSSKLQTVALEDTINLGYGMNNDIGHEKTYYNTRLPTEDSIPSDFTSEADHYTNRNHSPSPGQEYIQQPPSIQNPGTILLDNMSSIEFKKSNSSLEEGLLTSKRTTKTLATGAASFVGQKQKVKDGAFLLLYIGCGLLFFVINFIVLIKASQSSLVTKYASETIYRAIRESLGAVVITILITVLTGLVWLASICILTKPLMWFIFLSIPVASFSIFILMLTRGFVGFSSDLDASNPSYHSKVLSLIPLTVTVVHSFLIHRYHSSVRQSIEIVKMATVVLKDNIDIFGVSLLCLASHIMFSSLWLISFDRLFLIGHMDTIEGKKLWTNDSVLSILVPFYVGFFWWTSSIINNIERCSIAGTVSQWYFHKKSNHINGYNPTKVALKRALTTSFGSLSLAGLIMTLVSGIKFLRGQYERQRLFRGSGLVAMGFRLVFSPVIFMAQFVDSISSFSVSYIGISGKPFMQSARIASSVLKRNFFRTLVANYVIRVTVYSAIITASTLNGYFFFMFSADTLHSSHFLIVSTIGVGIPFYVLKFMMNTLLYTTDAVYLCYGIDLEQKTIHSSLAHETLAGP